MAIITISRGSYSHGKKIAEKVAQKLGYKCIARDILLEASKDFNVPEFKLIQALEDAPSTIDRIMSRKEKYIAFIKAAVLKHCKNDNVVYHGFAGHFFVKEIPHVLKVRIIADLEDRVKLVMERDGISKNEAVRSINKLDEERTKWSQHLYGINTWDPALYDLVIHIKRIMIDNAVDIICNNVGLKQFQTTSESQQAMDDLCLASEVKASLIDLKTDIEVSAQKGIIYIKTRAPQFKNIDLLVHEMRGGVEKIPGVKDMKINFIPPITSVWDDPM
jgi:cytidylate kinase